VLLLAQIVRILTQLPFFRTSLIGILNKILASQDPFHDLVSSLNWYISQEHATDKLMTQLNQMIQSGKREQIIAGLSLASALINMEPLDPMVGATGHGASSTLPIRVWNMLVEGGTVKGLGKLMVMRKRNKEGTADYGDKDPMDKPGASRFSLPT
jgi:nucleolar pre-ribosomal-associated protein 1